METLNISLTKDNISNWLIELDIKMKLLYDINNYSNLLSKEEWLLEYDGCIVNAAIENYIPIINEPKEKIMEIRENNTIAPISSKPIEENITKGTNFVKWFFGNKGIWVVLAVWTFVHIMIFTHFNEYFIEMTPAESTLTTSIFDIGITILFIGGLVKWFKAKKSA